jgi:hypothetical protein
MEWARTRKINFYWWIEIFFTFCEFNACYLIGVRQIRSLGKWFARKYVKILTENSALKVFFRSSKSDRAKESGIDFVTSFNESIGYEVALLFLVNYAYASYYKKVHRGCLYLSIFEILLNICVIRQIQIFGIRKLAILCWKTLLSLSWNFLDLQAVSIQATPYSVDHDCYFRPWKVHKEFPNEIKQKRRTNAWVSCYSST